MKSTITITRTYITVAVVHGVCRVDLTVSNSKFRVSMAAKQGDVEGLEAFKAALEAHKPTTLKQFTKVGFAKVAGDDAEAGARAVQQMAIVSKDFSDFFNKLAIALA